MLEISLSWEIQQFASQISEGYRRGPRPADGCADYLGQEIAAVLCFRDTGGYELLTTVATGCQQCGRNEQTPGVDLRLSRPRAVSPSRLAAARRRNSARCTSSSQRKLCRGGLNSTPGTSGTKVISPARGSACRLSAASSL